MNDKKFKSPRLNQLVAELDVLAKEKLAGIAQFDCEQHQLANFFRRTGVPRTSIVIEGQHTLTWEPSQRNICYDDVWLINAPVEAKFAVLDGDFLGDLLIEVNARLRALASK